MGRQGPLKPPPGVLLGPPGNFSMPCGGARHQWASGPGGGGLLSTGPPRAEGCPRPGTGGRSKAMLSTDAPRTARESRESAASILSTPPPACGAALLSTGIVQRGGQAVPRYAPGEASSGGHPESLAATPWPDDASQASAASAAPAPAAYRPGEVFMQSASVEPDVIFPASAAGAFPAEVFRSIAAGLPSSVALSLSGLKPKVGSEVQHGSAPISSAASTVDTDNEEGCSATCSAACSVALTPAMSRQSSEKASLAPKKVEAWGLAQAGSASACSEAASACGEEANLGSAECPSEGSRHHHLGGCKPCAFVFKGGCQAGPTCQFCHLCGPGEKKRRIRESKATKRAAAPTAALPEQMVVGSLH